MRSTDWRIDDVDPLYVWRGMNREKNDTITNGKSSYKQGHFENCILKVGCIGNYYPANTIKGFYSGTYSWRTGG